MDWQNSFEALGPDGPFPARLPGFVARESQQEMAARIEQAIADREVFIAESGTGTGKTFAYLVPALLSGRRVLISTGTKNLQDQLFQRDLPLVRAGLGVPVGVALLKGRANYLCLQRIEQAEAARGAARRHEAELGRLRLWAARTRTGDIAEVSDVPENSPWWPFVTSTTDNCLGGDCPHFENCHVNRARREALKADVVVVNHHLFFADLALREEGFGQILPGADAVIFDEAHQLPEIATQFFGLALSSHQLTELARDTMLAEGREKSAVAGLAIAAEGVERAATSVRAAFGADRRGQLGQVLADSRVRAGLEQLRAGLAELSALLEPAAEAGEGLAACARRTGELLDRLERITEPGGDEHLAWFETGPRSLVLRLTPMNIARPFREQMARSPKAWVFTSATLAVGESFAHFQSQLGLDEAATARWDSPFDYRSQTLLYVPPGLPAPNAPEFTQKVVEAALPVLQASRGRAFFLFTSHRALAQAAQMIAGRLPFPLFVQGSAPPAELLVRFRAAPNAVLLGTGSFWEGVDVRGEALSCVIIDKLPFAAPDDPVLQARGEAMERLGQNPFMEYQLPTAVIALKQGVGRLIRDSGDRGVLVLCDPRLLTKGYGRVFLNSLPPMPLTRSVADVQSFFGAAGAAAPG